MNCAQKQVVGLPQCAGHYASTASTPGHVNTSTVPPRSTKVVIAGHECYIDSVVREGSRWYLDGNKVDTSTAYGKVYRAGVGILHRSRHIIARVTGPQCSYRTELLGAATLSHVVCAIDNLAIDNQAVVRTAAKNPHRECADMDVRKEAHANFLRTPIHIRWIPSHHQVQNTWGGHTAASLRSGHTKSNASGTGNATLGHCARRAAGPLRLCIQLLPLARAMPPHGARSLGHPVPMIQCIDWPRWKLSCLCPHRHPLHGPTFRCLQG